MILSSAAVAFATSSEGDIIVLYTNDDSTADVYALLERIDAIRNCGHICHSGNWFLKVLWSIANFFRWFFKTVPTCVCGMVHY